MSKRRLTVTVDEAILEQGRQAVTAGIAESLSAWVNAALQASADKQRRLVALAEFVADHEREFGVITEAEMRQQQRADRSAAVVVRPAPAARQSA